MGLLDLFSREKACDICETIVHKKQLYGIDPSFRGKREGAKRIEICRDCFLVEMKKSFTDYEGRAVFFPPLLGYNAYHFIQITKDKRSSVGIFNIEDVSFDYEKLAPKSGQRCSKCNNEAKYSWAEVKNMETSDYLEIFTKSTEDFNTSYLCSSCIGEILENIITKEELVLQEFITPIDSDGFYISYEY